MMNKMKKVTPMTLRKFWAKALVEEMSDEADLARFRRMWSCTSVVCLSCLSFLRSLLTVAFMMHSQYLFPLVIGDGQSCMNRFISTRGKGYRQSTEP